MNLRTLISWLRWGPEAARLTATMEEARIDVDNWIAISPTPPRAQDADKFLRLAQQHVDAGRLQCGWDLLQAAHRQLVARDIGEARRKAVALGQEVNKLSGWRAKAIPEYLKRAKGLPEAEELSWILEALALRDDYFRTSYFKISMRRSFLMRINAILIAGLVIFWGLCWAGLFKNTPFEDPVLVTLVSIFGVFGASVSVSQGLLRSDITEKIPAQKVAAFVVWMRPAIGAVAALAAMVLLNAIDGANNRPPEFLLAIAFVAGYSERFIVGAVDRFARSEERKS